MKYKFSDVVQINPKETLEKNKLAKKISMKDIDEYEREIKGFEYKPYKSGPKFRNGDVLFARITPCLENGKTAQVNILKNDEIAFGSTEFMIFRAKEGLILPDYVYFLSISNYIRDNAIKSMTGTSGRQRVQKDIFNELEIDIPDIKVQEKRVAILNSYDKKIEINNKIIKNLEVQAQAIFKSWFIDFEPFQDGEFIESELGLIPKGWKIKKLKDLSKKIVTGKTPPTKYKHYYGDDTMFITIPDMHDKIFTIETERYLSNLGVNYQPKKTIPAGSICVSCIATVGLVILTSEDSHTNQQINSIIPKDEYYKFFIFNYLRNKKQYLEAIGSSGSTTKNINKGTFSNILIPVPKKEIVIKFHKIVNNKYKLIEKLQYENKKLAQIRDTLLPKLMSGQIDLSDIDIGDSHEKE